jgi:hypothetical protein
MHIPEIDKTHTQTIRFVIKIACALVALGMMLQRVDDLETKMALIERQNQSERIAGIEAKLDVLLSVFAHRQSALSNDQGEPAPYLPN